MTAPRFMPCKCGHGKTDHDALAPQCSATACTCLAYRPNGVSPPRQLTVTEPKPAGRPIVLTQPSPDVHVHSNAPAQPGPTVEQLIAAAKRSHAVFTRRLAERIEKQVKDLLGRVAAERDAADRKRREDAEREKYRDEVHRLEAELAAAKAKLRRQAPPSPANSTPLNCPDCGGTFAKPQGLGSHRARAHGYRKAG